MRQILLLMLLALFFTGCESTATDRVDLDEQVGIDAIDTAEIRVRNGLAAVRRFRDGHVELWAQSPVLQIDIAVHASAATSWELLVYNCMPTAILTATSASGNPIPVDQPAPLSETALRWSFAPAVGETTRITVAPQDALDQTRFRFAVLSDIQSAIDRFGDFVDRLNADPEISFVVSTGDLTDNGDRDQLVRFQTELQHLGCPFYSTVGNHELFAGDPNDWAELFGRASFHFVFKGVNFCFVDSASATVHPTVYAWLDAWLDQPSAPLRVVLTHIPPLDPAGTRSGAFASRKEAAKFIALMAEKEVGAAYFGHIHSFYAFSLGGVPAYISGGGGAIPERFDGIGRHFLIVDVFPPQQALTVAMVRVD